MSVTPRAANYSPLEIGPQLVATNKDLLEKPIISVLPVATALVLQLEFSFHRGAVARKTQIWLWGLLQKDFTGCFRYGWPRVFKYQNAFEFSIIYTL